MKTRITISILAAVMLAAPATAQAPETGSPDAGPAEPMDAVDLLLDRVEELQATVDALRTVLAESKLDLANARRELDELHQFMEDYYEFGRDFEQYRAVKAVAEREARRKQIEQARRQRDARRLEQTAKQREVMARRAERQAELERVEAYRRAGFTPLGFDVYMSNAAFNYETYDGVAARYDWNLLTGTYVRVYPFGPQVDFSTMTISGSVMSASDQVRDIGIAVTFFDESGTQVGSEIIQVNNARPEVPYPFTTTVEMALDRPFASTTTYVLYADPVDPAATAPGTERNAGQ